MTKDTALPTDKADPKSLQRLFQNNQVWASAINAGASWRLPDG